MSFRQQGLVFALTWVTLGRLVAAAEVPAAPAVLNALEACERRLLASERVLAVAEERAAEARRHQAYAHSLQALTRLKLTKAERRLGQRLASLARRQLHTRSHARLGSQRLSTWLDRERMWRAIANHDHRLYDEVRRAQATIDRSLARMQQAAATLAVSQRQARRSRNALVAERRRRRALAASLQRRKPAGSTLAAWHQQGQRALAAAFMPSGPASDSSYLPSIDPTSPSFDRLPPRQPQAASRLPWPADGPVRTSFGERIDLRFGTATRHQGIAIAATAGSPVTSVAAGDVLFADWLTGYGRTIILGHAQGLQSVHAHLATMQVREGQHVEAGAPLGEVGDTGSLRGTLLYFELREHGSPVDPLTLLQPR